MMNTLYGPDMGLHTEGSVSAGKGHAHNVGVSLLEAVGLGCDWVARTEDQYVELAVRHAADLPALATLRESLRDRVLSSPLCDAPTFVMQLEDVYDRLYDHWLAEGPRIWPEPAVGKAVCPMEGPQKWRQPGLKADHPRPETSAAGQPLDDGEPSSKLT